METRLRTFSYHYREKYGHPVGKIALDMGVVCPNRKKGGCIFCLPAGFTPAYLRPHDDIALQLSLGKKKLLKNRFSQYLAYFQQETTTALPTARLMPVFRSVLQDTSCIGLIISTRPDFVDQQLLVELEELITRTSKECLFELGLQSIHNSSLKLLNRNHRYVDFLDAIERIRRIPCFEVGAHLILGIPGESEEDMVESIRILAALGIDALKLHHLQVLKGTDLEIMYNKGEVPLFSSDEYSRFLLKVLPLIPAEVTLHRLWSTAHPELLVAPRWDVLATHLSRNLLQKMENLDIRQGQLCS